MAELGPLPNFLIIGAQRSATRWLRVNLDHHPEIFMCARETGFFTDPNNIKILNQDDNAAYRKYFAGWSGEPYVGESDPSYFFPDFSRDTAIRIGVNLPDVKLILLLRNPVDRYFSALYDAIKKGDLPAGTDLNQLDPETIQRLDVFPKGCYERSLNPYLYHFGDRLHIEFFDDLVDDPDALYRRVLTHIGADPDFRPEGLEQPLFTSRRIAASIPPISEENRATMAAFFRPSVKNVEELLGRPLPESWYQD